MPLHLSNADLRRIAPCSRVLSSPFDYPSFESWSEAAARATEAALGADHTTIAVRQDGRLRAYTNSVSVDAVSTYFLHVLSANERQWGMEHRQIALGAWSRADTWGPRLRDMYRSAYWHELIVPNRAFDTIGLSVSTAGGGAHLQLYHGGPTGRRFGERGVALLRVLYGAFASGVRSWATLELHRQELARFADAIPAALAFATMDGRIVHRNAALERLLAGERRRIEVLEEVARTARRVAQALAGRPPATSVGGLPAVASGGASPTAAGYRLSVCSLNAALLGSSGTLVVTVERLGRPPFPSAILKQSYGLTGRETEVAQLLTDGLSNSEIAARIGVSGHTARHHTESLMLKLGIHSRAQIAALVGRLATPH